MDIENKEVLRGLQALIIDLKITKHHTEAEIEEMLSNVVVDNPNWHRIWKLNCMDNAEGAKNVYGFVHRYDSAIIELTDIETNEIPAIGNCAVCGAKEVKLKRTYFRYQKTKCECHSPYHFDLVDHCHGCVAKIPSDTKITHKVSNTTTDEKSNQ